MRHAIFISGTEELLLVDETGLARIFSLVTEQFRYVIAIVTELFSNALSALLHTCWIVARPRFMPYPMEQHSLFWI